MDKWATALPVLSLAVAVLAVFVGPAIQLAIARKQIRATVLSANRQRWIDELRQQIAEFITLAGELSSLAKMDMNAGRATIDKTSKMQLCRMKIMLMLNSKEPDHRQLLALLEAASKGIYQSEEDDGTNIPGLVALSQSILKREWERVKSLQ